MNSINSQLDSQSHKELIESELKTDIDELSDKLGGYQLNSEKKIAWIVSIKEKSDTEIIVEFLLPSTDTFTKVYNIENNRLSEDNSFRELIEHIGYDVHNAELVIGEKIDIEYNEMSNNWVPKINYDEPKSNTQNLNTENSKKSYNKKLRFYAVLATLFNPIVLVIILRYTRGLGIFALISIAIGFYILIYD